MLSSAAVIKLVLPPFRCILADKINKRLMMAVSPCLPARAVGLLVVGSRSYTPGGAGGQMFNMAAIAATAWLVTRCLRRAAGAFGICMIFWSYC